MEIEGMEKPKEPKLITNSTIGMIAFFIFLAFVGGWVVYFSLKEGNCEELTKELVTEKQARENLQLDLQSCKDLSSVNSTLSSALVQRLISLGDGEWLNKQVGISSQEKGISGRNDKWYQKSMNEARD